MLELSLHILDVVENSLAAGASLVVIELTKDQSADILRLTIEDDGRGMSAEELARAADPFFTTRTTRKVGLGLALLRQAAEMCGGAFSIDSTPGEGTRLSAEFRLSHVDRAPLGDLAGTLMSLIVGRPEVEFVYRQVTDGEKFVVDTREIKAVLDGAPLSSSQVVGFLRRYIEEGLAALGSI